MKTVHKTRKTKTNGQRARPKPRFDGSNGSIDSLFPVQTKQNLIQWPTGQQIQEVSKRLAQINRAGIRWEASGDYFSSGDIAYQLQEIIRATSDLFKKIQRINR
jgi:hypothetical protein